MASSRRTIYLENKPFAALVPQSRYFVFEEKQITPRRKYVLSRFVYLHTEERQIVVESPLSFSRILLQHWMASVVVHMLAQPVSVMDILRRLPELGKATASEFMGLLLNSQMIKEVNDRGSSIEDDNASLQSWEFHDLLFHSRSRAGRHDHPAGGTYRLSGIVAPPPVVKKVNEGEAFPLYRPDLKKIFNEDPPFGRVQEERCSIREYSEEPITDQQLGEFLYRVGRISDYQKGSSNTAKGQVQIELAYRPYPSGGALYELDLYVLINRCKNLRPGLYFYDPERHRLMKVSGANDDTHGLLRDAGSATMISADQIQTLILISARFQRLAWKYSTIAYALILKNVGVLYQTMYLAATAMGLAPCAVGYGDSDLFANAAGTEYAAETTVGEFLLGSRP